MWELEYEASWNSQGFLLKLASSIGALCSAYTKSSTYNYQNRWDFHIKKKWPNFFRVINVWVRLRPADFFIRTSSKNLSTWKGGKRDGLVFCLRRGKKKEGKCVKCGVNVHCTRLSERKKYVHSIFLRSYLTRKRRCAKIPTHHFIMTTSLSSKLIFSLRNLRISTLPILFIIPTGIFLHGNFHSWGFWLFSFFFFL